MKVVGAALAAIAFLYGPALAADPALFQVGFSVVDINPTTAQYLGGFGQNRLSTGTNPGDGMEVRAMAVANGASVVVFAIVDTQGYFAGYQEGAFGVSDARAAAADTLGIAPANVIISSTHSHAAPTIMGIWGPTDPDYLRKVYEGTVQAVVDAATHLAPANLYSAEADVAAVNGSAVSQTDAYQGWRVDGKLPILWARDPLTGATRGLYANVPVHADLVNGTLISADHIGVERRRLGDDLGGTAVVAMGTLGRQESFVQGSGLEEADRVGDHIANEIERALAAARPITDSTIGAVEQLIAAPVTNPLLVALNYGNLAGPQQTPADTWTIDRSVLPPYVLGPTVGTWVNAVRIGDVVYATEPGEAFPEVSSAIRRVFNGPSVGIVGMALDQLGYFYPAETYPWTFFNNSDHQIYNVSLLLADEVVAAHVVNAALLGFAPTPARDTSQFDDLAQAMKAGVQFIPIPRERAIDAGGRATITFEAATSGAALRRAPWAATLNTVPNLLDSHSDSIQWSFGDGGTLTGTEKVVTHDYAAPGTYTVTATVIDPQNGESSTWAQQVIVDPVLAASVGIDGDALTASTAGGQGTLLAAHWTFDGGVTSDGITVTRPPGAHGSVTAVDAAGNRATTSF